METYICNTKQKHKNTSLLKRLIVMINIHKCSYIKSIYKNGIQSTELYAVFGMIYIYTIIRGKQFYAFIFHSFLICRTTKNAMIEDNTAVRILLAAITIPTLSLPSDVKCCNDHKIGIRNKNTRLKLIINVSFVFPNPKNRAIIAQLIPRGTHPPKESYRNTLIIVC